MKKGKIRITLKGGNHAAFISAAANGGITLTDIERDGNVITVVCDGKDENALRKIAARTGLLFTVTARDNVRTRAKDFLRHAGAFVAAIVVAASFIASRFFVFSVCVEGVSPDRAAKITSALREAGIDGITLKSAIDTSEIEKLVVADSDDLAFAEAYVDGVKLVINVREQLPEPVQNEENGVITSSRDAIVTRVEVSGGTALVKAGDTVRKGQTLIADYIIVGDVNDPEHKELQTAAKGEVYGRVWYTERLTIPALREETVRTGRKYASSALYIGDRLMIPASDGHGFTQYEKVSEVKKINAVLPFTLVTNTYYETVRKTVETDENYLQSEVYASFARLYAQLDDSATVLTSYKSQKKVDNYYIIILYYEIEQPIGCREA